MVTLHGSIYCCKLEFHMKYFPNHLIQTNTKWKKPVIPTRLGLWVPNVNIWKKKKMHRQIARFIALKYFTTNVSEVEKNALKCQFDKSQKNIFHMCLHLGILKQDGRSNSHSNIRLKHQLLRSWFREFSQKFFSFQQRQIYASVLEKLPPYSRYLPPHYLKNMITLRSISHKASFSVDILQWCRKMKTNTTTPPPYTTRLLKDHISDSISKHYKYITIDTQSTFSNLKICV